MNKRSLNHKLIHLARHWPILIAAVTALAALVLLRQSASEPIALGSIGQIDGLSAFFALTTLGGLALSIAGGSATRPSWRIPATAVALLLAYGATQPLVIAGCYALVALLALPLIRPNRLDPKRTQYVRPRTKDQAGKKDRPGPWFLALRGTSVVRGAAMLLAAIALLGGYGALSLRGASRYDQTSASFVLDSAVFWLVLLSALSRCWHSRATRTRSPSLKTEIPVRSETSCSDLGSSKLPGCIHWRDCTALARGTAAGRSRLCCSAERPRSGVPQ
jgi:hypothetical protein